LNNLTQRIITAIIGAAIVLGAIIYSEFSFLLLVLFICIMSLIEFFKLASHDNIKGQLSMAILISVILFIPAVLNAGFNITLDIFRLLYILPFIIFIRELYTNSEKPFTNISFTIVSLIYLTLPLFLFYLLSFSHSHSYNYQNILGFFFLLWASDTGAYFAGKHLGKHKLFERISPKKTWEGFIGGLILACLVALLISRYFTHLTTQQWLTVAIIIVTTGTLGDLVESMFKRSMNVKDSGSILPGHGGFLDRFDGLFISVPFVFFYLEVM
jgi:phosphatidate cytidylyltransferase